MNSVQNTFALFCKGEGMKPEDIYAKKPELKDIFANEKDDDGDTLLKMMRYMVKWLKNFVRQENFSLFSNL